MSVEVWERSPKRCPVAQSLVGTRGRSSRQLNAFAYMTVNFVRKFAYEPSRKLVDLLHLRMHSYTTEKACKIFDKNKSVLIGPCVHVCMYVCAYAASIVPVDSFLRILCVIMHIQITQPKHHQCAKQVVTDRPREAIHKTFAEYILTCSPDSSGV